MVYKVKDTTLSGDSILKGEKSNVLSQPDFIKEKKIILTP